MNKTKNHNRSQIGNEKLSMDQLNAIDLLIQGKTDQETANIVGVTRETVNRWRNKNPYFQAELNNRRRELWGAAHERLRSLLTRAVDILEKNLDEGSLKSALELLRILGIHGEVGAPTGPVDPELVLWRAAEQWARIELARRGPSEDPLKALFDEDAAIAGLARQRMEELRGEHGLGDE